MAGAKPKQKSTASSLQLGRSRPKPRIIDAKFKLQGKNLELAVEKFQAEPDEMRALEQTKPGEKSGTQK